MLLSLKFQANTYSFERVVTLFVGYYFSSGHRVVVRPFGQAIETVEFQYDDALKYLKAVVRYEP